MKNFTLTVLMSIMSTVVMAFTTFQRNVIEVPLKIEPSRPLVLVIPTPKTKIKIPKIILKDHNAFLNAIGHYESSNRYHITNRLGYMGRYQFGRATLKSLGIKVSKKEFLSNPSLQEEAMDRLLTENYKNLRRYIKKYEGTIVHGVLVTKSGVLAAAHLGGSGNIKKWFRRGIVFKDANGTKITTYMKQFGGYDLSI